ncbi:hypothetical protein H0H92_002155 [Tricholoma furcatifolium]|nr:hypothetical protein H0H92_002155 [Tricholoma furcatifolium]
MSLPGDEKAPIPEPAAAAESLQLQVPSSPQLDEKKEDGGSVDFGHAQDPAPGFSESGETTPPKEDYDLEKAMDDSDDDWDNDPINARNWSPGRKWTAAAIVSMYAFITPLASSMMAPGLPEIAIKYQITNSTVLAMTLSVFLLSFAFGPLILAPISEMYGRTYLFNICNIFSIGFSLGCAFSPTVGSLIGFRFLAGLSSSAPIACGGGSISDLFSERDRASAMALFSLGPLIGPAIGPIAGGFIAQNVGVKWVFIVIAYLNRDMLGVSGLASVSGIPLLRETYAPVLRYRKALASGDPEQIAKRRAILVQGTEGKLAYMWMSLTPFFAETYGFGAGIGGLTYLGLGVGFFIATIIGAKFSDKIYRYLSEKNGGKGTPEMRMPVLFFGSFFVPIGLFWYGWSAQAKIHWIMPIIGSGFFGFGLMTTTLPILLYLVDAFQYAASATAAAFVLRSLLGFVFPLFGQQMFNRLGLGGGNSLLAGVAIVLGIPFPVWIYYRGEAIRLRDKREDK